MAITSALRGAALALACFAASAQAQTVTPELAKVIAAAKQEGKLLLRSTTSVNGAAEGAKMAQDGIKRMFGGDLAVEWVPGPAFAPLAAVLYQEKQAGQPASGDVFVATPIPIKPSLDRRTLPPGPLFSPPAIQIPPYLARGLFQPVDWLTLMPDRIKPDYVEGGGRALRFM